MDESRKRIAEYLCNEYDEKNTQNLKRLEEMRGEYAVLEEKIKILFRSERLYSD